MANFAKIENNIVTQVIAVANEELLIDGIENAQKGIDLCVTLFGGEWQQTSWNANFRKNYAGIGYTYDVERDAFIAPKPYPSWLLVEATCQWTAPVPMPSDNKLYSWNEDTQSWLEQM